AGALAAGSARGAGAGSARRAVVRAAGRSVRGAGSAAGCSAAGVVVSGSTITGCGAGAAGAVAGEGDAGGSWIEGATASWPRAEVEPNASAAEIATVAQSEVRVSWVMDKSMAEMGLSVRCGAAI